MSLPIVPVTSAIHLASFSASAPTPPESPLTFLDLPLDLTSSNSYNSALSPSISNISSASSMSLSSPLPSPSPRPQRRSVPSSEKDAQYRQRRDKNNIAAKKSRDARRAREAETAERAKKLEEAVVRLKAENDMLRREYERLQRLPMQ